jgi:hypothetical protein
MEQILEKLSRFNKISGGIKWIAGSKCHSTAFNSNVNIWYDANPFVLGICLSHNSWYPPKHQPVYLLIIFYGDIIYPRPRTKGRNTGLEITVKEELTLSFVLKPTEYSHTKKPINGFVKTYQTSVEILSFLDAIPNDLALCLDIPWAKPLIELAYKNN